MLPFRTLIILGAVLTGIFTSYSLFAADEIFDRLDGKGPSKKRVDVIEWEGNLEIHVYPKGSESGLSAKIDDRTEGKKVMVIGYRFNGQKDRLIRRAILGIPFTKQVKGFIDPTEKEFDKFAISNHTLAAPWKEYKLEASPAQWYPDGDERNEIDPAVKSAPYLGEIKVEPRDRSPASQPDSKNQRPSRKSQAEDGAVENFSW